MAKPNKSVSKKATARNGAPRKSPRKSRQKVAPGSRGADNGLSAAGVAGLARQLSEITRTLRDQQRAIEHLIAIHEAAPNSSGLPSEPNETVGSIPRISLVPPRAA